jgi:hypothetical protein
MKTWKPPSLPFVHTFKRTHQFKKGARIRTSIFHGIINSQYHSLTYETCPKKPFEGDSLSPNQSVYQMFFKDSF